MSQPVDRDDERAPNERPVSAVAPQQLTVTTAAGTGRVPMYATSAWDLPRATVKRAVILIHGRLRNADAYYNLARRARAAASGKTADTVLIVPQFLAAADIAAHRLPPENLHWDWISWMGGEPAQGPAPISSFEVLDAILRQLAQREKFPELCEVVIAGHSGGGQVVQRYAVVTQGEAPLAERGIALRYVVANPSSYVYFDTLRPDPAGGFSQFDAAGCPHFNRWKYGLDQAPAYARLGQNGLCAAQLEAAYAQRDVVTLLGGNDCDPRHPALDISCAAQAQGENRLARGRAYARYLRMRHPQGLNHRYFEVPGVGHDGDGIFTSAAGLAALFGA